MAGWEQDGLAGGGIGVVSIIREAEVGLEVVRLDVLLRRAVHERLGTAVIPSCGDNNRFDHNYRQTRIVVSFATSCA